MSVALLDREPIQHDAPPETSDGVAGVLAQFAGPHELTHAADMVRAAGYTRTDAFSPFPIHGMDEALGIRPTVLPWIVLSVGICGCIGGLLMQWWMNAVDYPFSISGKPLFSLPANIPVTFEIIVLTSAFATFLGMLGLNRLPMHSNALFSEPRFRRVTDDAFFLYVRADDPKFENSEVVELFRMAGAIWIGEVAQPTTSAKIPGLIKGLAAILVALALVPPVWIARARNTTSDVPRIDLFSDMDSQNRPGAQQRTELFADGRAMRPQVPGTIAVGDLQEDDAFYRGILPDEDGPAQPVIPPPPAEANANAPAGAAPVAPEPHYVTEFPIEVTPARMLRGQMQFNVYCAPCHGLAGQGDGLISQRAIELQESTWVPPTNLTNQVVSAQPVGKLFDTITNGRRKMAGYAAQIAPEDRWAVVLYLRALQRSQQASLDEVPKEKAAVLENQK